MFSGAGYKLTKPIKLIHYNFTEDKKVSVLPKFYLFFSLHYVNTMQQVNIKQ